MLPLFLCVFYAIPLCRKCRVRAGKHRNTSQTRTTTGVGRFLRTLGVPRLREVTGLCCSHSVTFPTTIYSSSSLFSTGFHTPL